MSISITNFDIVFPGKLYRGAQPNADQFAELKELSVTTSIDLREPWGREAEEKACNDIGIHHVNIPIGFSPLSFGIEPPTDDELKRIFSITEDPKSVCFIHCEHGADRTGAVVAAYRMSFQGWTNDQALTEAEEFHLNPFQIFIKDWIENFKFDGKR